MKKAFSFLSLVLVALAFASCAKNTPEGVVEEYVSCIQKEDYVGATDLFLFKEEPTDSQREEFASLLKDKVGKEIERKKGLDGVEIKNVEMAEDGESAKVSYTMKYGDGSTKDTTSKLVKKDGKWKIDIGK